jgi:hypothetical protein
MQASVSAALRERWGASIPGLYSSWADTRRLLGPIFVFGLSGRGGDRGCARRRLGRFGCGDD